MNPNDIRLNAYRPNGLTVKAALFMWFKNLQPDSIPTFSPVLKSICSLLSNQTFPQSLVMHYHLCILFLFNWQKSIQSLRELSFLLTNTTLDGHGECDFLIILDLSNKLMWSPTSLIIAGWICLHFCLKYLWPSDIYVTLGKYIVVVRNQSSSLFQFILWDCFFFKIDQAHNIIFRIHSCR